VEEEVVWETEKEEVMYGWSYDEEVQVFQTGMVMNCNSFPN
jgi:hypothetical protein